MLNKPSPHLVGYPRRDADLDVLPGFVNPPPGYGQVAFYWWLGDPLVKERIQWQLDRLKGKSMKGLQVNYAHSDSGGRSYGLTYPSEPQLFSEEWWELFGWFLRKAKELGMSVSLSDYILGIPGQGCYMDVTTGGVDETWWSSVITSEPKAGCLARAMIHRTG